MSLFVRSETTPRLPVLLYHRIGLPPDGVREWAWLTISPEQFDRQLAWLVSRGYSGVRPSDWVLARSGRRRLPEKPVLITFDDAYADLSEYALPVLRRYGFYAAVFVVTGKIGATNAWDEAGGYATHRIMTAEQIRYWSSHGIEFGAHGRTHRNLTTLSISDLNDEVAGSAEELSAILGKQVVSFSYPYGACNRLVQDHVRRAFDVAFTSKEGLNDTSTDPHLLKRTMVKPSDSISTLTRRVSWGYSPVERFLLADVRKRLFSRLSRKARSMFGPESK